MCCTRRIGHCRRNGAGVDILDAAVVDAGPIQSECHRGVLLVSNQLRRGPQHVGSTRDRDLVRQLVDRVGRATSSSRSRRMT